MTRRLAAAIGLVLATAAALPAAAFEYTRFEPLWMETGPPGAWRDTPALLNLPAGWHAGDAAVILLTDRGEPDALHGALLVSLIEEGTAVLELATGATAGPGVLRADVDTALRELRRQAGAGLVVAIGLGSRAEAALAGPGSPGLAAVATLGPGPATFRSPDPPPPAEGWGLRAPLLCTALASAKASGSTPLPPGVVAAGAAETDAACRAALVPGGHLVGLR